MKLVPARGLDGAFEFREFAHRAIVHIELVRSTATSFSVAAANRVSRFREESTVESAALYAEFVRTDPRDRPQTNQSRPRYESVRVPAYPPTVPRACKISCETQERHQQERHQQ